jgi:hypothetical protein
VLRFFSLLCAFALNLFAFAFSAPVSRVPAVQMSTLAGGGSLPGFRRNRQIQRQSPVFPPFKIGRAAPISRIAAGVNGGNIGQFRLCVKSLCFSVPPSLCVTLFLLPSFNFRLLTFNAYLTP